MFANVLNSTTIPALQEVIGFAQTRHELLAGNMANIDTPDYQIRDLSVETFQARLKEALETRNATKEPLSSGLIGDERDDEMHKVRETLKHITFHDGSDLSMEHQVAEMSKNQFMHNLAISLMNSQFRLLQTAISERI